MYVVIYTDPNYFIFPKVVDEFAVAFSYKTDLKIKLNDLIDKEALCRKLFSNLATAVSNCKNGIFTCYEDLQTVINTVKDISIIDGSILKETNELVAESEEQLLNFNEKVKLLKWYELNDNHRSLAEEMKTSVDFYPLQKEDHNNIKLTCDIYLTLYKCRESIDKIRGMSGNDLDNSILFTLRELKKSLIRLSSEAVDENDKAVIESTKESFLLVDWCYEVRYILQNNSSIEVAEKLLNGNMEHILITIYIYFYLWL